MKPVYLLCVSLIAGFLFSAAALTEVALYGRTRDLRSADAALVLGAAVIGESPSPVFRERIRHAVALYQTGQVRALVMTGGLGPGDRVSEGQAAAEWARKEGVPLAALLVENRSRTTWENLSNSVPLLREHKLDRVLIVSDPLHMRRAMTIATDLGLQAQPSPTPTSRYTGWRSWIVFLARETYHLNRCRILGRC
jgi:uncharacterized SAM-binding protein YcdF (DUF218 family)